MVSQNRKEVTLVTFALRGLSHGVVKPLKKCRYQHSTVFHGSLLLGQKFNFK